VSNDQIGHCYLLQKAAAKFWVMPAMTTIPFTTITTTGTALAQAVMLLGPLLGSFFLLT